MRMLPKLLVAAVLAATLCACSQAAPEAATDASLDAEQPEAVGQAQEPETDSDAGSGSDETAADSATQAQPGGSTPDAGSDVEPAEESASTAATYLYPAVDLPTELAEVPDSYTQPCAQPGTVERFDYSLDALPDAASANKYAMVYLPYGYGDDSDRRYNVLYLMHGAGGDAEAYLGTPDQGTTTRNIIDNLVANGDMPPLIIVSCTFYPNNESYDTDDWGASLTKAFPSELHECLIPQLEGTYRTYAQGTDAQSLIDSRAHRAFGGFSMGGVTTWYAMCECLDYIGCYLPMSGSLYWGDEAVNGGVGRGYAGAYVADAVAQQGYGASDFFVFAATGSKDYAIGIMNPQVNELKNYPELFSFGDDGAQPNIVYLVADGEEHDTHGRARMMYNALPVMLEMMEGASE